MELNKKNQQLDQKDKQIDDLTKLLDQQQQLHGQMPAEKQQMLESPDLKDWSLWERMTGKKQ